MSERELVDAYLEGRIGSWTFVRRLAIAGVSVGTAVALAAGLPAAARSGDFSALQKLAARTAAAKPGDSQAVQRLMEHVVKGWDLAIDKHKTNELRTAVAKLALNVADLNARNNNNNFNNEFSNTVGGMPVAVNCNMSRANENEAAAARKGANENTMAMSMSGNFGNIPIALNGNVKVNTDGKGGVGHVNVVAKGNAGDMPVNFNS